MSAWASNGNFFHSVKEDNPWLKVQLNKPTVVYSVTVGNRKDCCGDRSVSGPRIAKISGTMFFNPVCVFLGSLFWLPSL